MLIRINGKQEDIQVATLGDLLQSKNIEPQMVSVELNNTMIDRTNLTTTLLKEGDSIELLFFMGGGSGHDLRQ